MKSESLSYAKNEKEKKKLVGTVGTHILQSV